MGETWSDRSWAAIGRLVAEGEGLGLSGSALEKHVRKGYPFRRRQGWPYQAWLRAVRLAFGDCRNPSSPSGSRRPLAGQSTFPFAAGGTATPPARTPTSSRPSARTSAPPPRTSGPPANPGED